MYSNYHTRSTYTQNAHSRKHICVYTPVSYTHLDVYKRQELPTAALPLHTRSSLASWIAYNIIIGQRTRQNLSTGAELPTAALPLHTRSSLASWIAYNIIIGQRTRQTYRRAQSCRLLLYRYLHVAP